MNNKLLELFVSNFQKNKEKLRKIGLEVEFPLVEFTGRAVKYDIVRGMFKFLKTKGFELYKDAETSEVIYAKKKDQSNISRESFHSIIGTDTGYCTIEIALQPEDSLFIVEKQFNSIIHLLSDYFRDNNCKILGYGIQPVTPPTQELMTNSARYIMAQHIMAQRKSMNRFIDQRNGADLHLWTITASNQCHIDISEDEAIRAVNILNGLSGLQIALTANSPVWLGSIDRQWKAVREIFWDYVCVELWKQVGIPKKFKDISDYIDYLCKFPPLMIQRTGHYFGILGQESFQDFLKSIKSSTALTLNGNEIPVLPDLKDIITHANFAWFNARLSPKYGTIESRISCQQPPGASILVAALVLGIIENIEEAEELLERYPWEEWKRLRYDSLRHALQAQIDNQPALPLVEKFTKIAEKGLQKRGLGEEKFLESAFRRIAEKKVPADDVIHLFQTNNLAEFFDSFTFH